MDRAQTMDVAKTPNGSQAEAPGGPPPTVEQALEAFLAGPQRRIDVGHSRLAYWRFGSGPDLVCVHGWPVSAATFRALLPTLARHFTCHLLDLPGAGHTETGTDAPIEIAAHGETLGRAIEALGLQRYALLAHDSGAVAARLHAAGNPRVTGLVFGGSEIPGHRPLLLQLIVGLCRIPGGGQLLVESMRLPAMRRSRLAFGSCFVDAALVEGDFKRLFLDPLFASREAMDNCAELARTLRFEVVDGLAAAHARITAPTLMVWGDRDPYFPVGQARAMAGQFGGPTRFESLPDASLFVHEEKPETFARLAVDFLREVTA